MGEYTQVYYRIDGCDVVEYTEHMGEVTGKRVMCTSLNVEDAGYIADSLLMVLNFKNLVHHHSNLLVTKDV